MLHGIALGDAMGAPVEKLSAAEIASLYGRVTGLDTAWHRAGDDAHARNHRIRGHGIVTDDTLMTFALMGVYEEVGRHLDAWDMAGPLVRRIAWEPVWIPEMEREAPLIDRLFHPEKWIFQRLQLAACDPRQGGVGNMVNCGAAMYIAPVGVVNAGDPRAAYEEAVAFAMGHQQSYGLEAAGVMAACVAAALAPGATLGDVVEAALSLAKDGTRAAIAAAVGRAEELRRQGTVGIEAAHALQAVLAPYSPMGDDVRHGPGKAGVPTAAYQPSRLLSIEELPLALAFAVLAGGEFREAVVEGINSGRDTDSIGVMAGAILGALHGEDVIAPEDAATLDRANRFDLAAAADAFYDTALRILRDDVAAAEALAARRRALFAAA